MRRPWNSCVQISLRPSCVQATLVSGWRRKRRTRTFSRAWNLAYEKRQLDPEALAQALREAVGDLLTALAAAHPIRGADLEVYIADAFVHFDVAQGSFGGDSDAQLQAVARACAGEVLGDGIPLHVRWQLQADEKHLLVCAIPSNLLDALGQAATGHRLTLRHVRPTFACGWNRYGHHLSKGVCAFAVGDDSHTLLALVRNGVVEALDAGARPGEPAAGSSATSRLDAQVQRLVAGLGIAPEGIRHFVAVRHGSGSASLSARWKVYSHGKAAG